MQPMKIALIGYGKMGKVIERLALERGHEVLLRIDLDNTALLEKASLSRAEVAIEFSTPDTALGNLLACFEAGVPVVCGTTGWLDRFDEAKRRCVEADGALLYASNFSIGVNIFFEVNKRLAELMGSQPQYRADMEEIHHTQKKDQPSGTAISLAEQVVERIPTLEGWVNEDSADPSRLPILSRRVDPAPGTHIVRYRSAADSIEIIHTAHSREGFAAGALAAAEWLVGKRGVHTMAEVLGL